MRHHDDDHGGRRPTSRPPRRHDHAFSRPGDDQPGDDPRFEGWRGGRGGPGRGGGRHARWEDGWGGPARRGRGAIRNGILLLLAEEPMHGYQLMQELAARSRGAWRPSPGAIYPTLQRLEDKGLVRSDEDEERRVFRLTDTGQLVADRLALTGVAPWEAVGPAEHERGELRYELGHLVDAVRQAVRAGSPEQRRRVLVLLGDTRRAVYRILAEDEPADRSTGPTDGPTPGPTDRPTSSPTSGPPDGPTPSPTDRPASGPASDPAATEGPITDQ